ncbi:MAG: recombinase family protein [Planctomycetota bacterium]|jgi:DNA invertase Pin-like site-specific DNA recombinase
MATTSLKRRTAVGYIRVSTPGQAVNGESLADQRDRIEGYCRASRLQLVDVLEDGGYGGATLDRPGARRLLEMVDGREVDAVVIVKLDRLTRSLRDLGDIIVLVEDKKVQLCSISDSIDTKTASGRLVLNVLGSVVQWQREAIAERTKEVLDHKKSRGERVSRFAPYGFRFNADGRVVRDRREQAVIRKVLELREQGESYRDVSTILARHGYLSRVDRPFTATALQRIVKAAQD